MKIKEIEIINFRLLENIKISLDKDTTIIVGKNNCGKTSLTEVFYKCFKAKGERFKFEDFSLSVYEDFIRAISKYEDFVKALPHEKEVAWGKFIKQIPYIDIRIHITYSTDDNFAILQPYFVDLDEMQEIIIECKYLCAKPEELFGNILREFEDYKETKLKINILNYVKENFTKYYEYNILCTNNEKTSIKKLTLEEVQKLFIPKFIYAQRQVDDISEAKSKNLSKLCESFFALKTKDDETLTKEIDEALLNTVKTWDEKYLDIFKDFFDDLKKFGYPSLNCYEMQLKSHFEANKLLSGNTTVFYQDRNEHSLPESYNGLGYSNLIYIMLQLSTFMQEYDKENPGIMLLFIEEPEAHLHPQMQYTFIKNIKEYIKEKGWAVQIVISTHSAHIIAESEFTSVRYFDNSQEKVIVKDMFKFAQQTMGEGDKDKEENLRFLKQYMALNYCEMFFADKIIMIEGTVERLLLPHMIRKCDESYSTNLMHQYVSTIEVGGAYAYKFKELLEFINVKTLVITDIDSINTEESREACKVSEGNQTSNQTLCTWIPAKVQIQQLLQCNDDEKINGITRVAYQIPEQGSTLCGRSFEEAFILANGELFINERDNIQSLGKRIYGKCKTKDDVISNSYELANSITKKTDFTFNMLLIGKDKWEIPRYIKEGLVWLAQ